MRKRTIGGQGLAAFLAIVLVMAGIFGGTAFLERRQQSKREAELEAKRAELQASMWTDENTVFLGDSYYGFDHRLETFLFIGTDNGGNQSADPENYYGPMADFLLLMILDHSENTIGYIQIDRNTVTDVKELDVDGEFMLSRQLQITTAHWYGHNPEMCAENTVDAVKNYLGGLENIDGYYVINMKDIGRLNHTVGGVEVTVEDDLDPNDPALSRGHTLTLDDTQAETFLRARMNVGSGTNAERMARQRQFMGAFFEKVRQKTLENPKFGVELFDMLKDVAVTNMNGSDFSRIAQKLLKGENKGIHTIKGETKLGTILNDGEEHEEFYPDRDSLREEMIEMFSLVRIEDGGNWYGSDDDEDLEDEDEDLDDEDEDLDDEDEESDDEDEESDDEDEESDEASDEADEDEEPDDGDEASDEAKETAGDDTADAPEKDSSRATAHQQRCV